jgi:NAD(P)-dependent dehydrogenase (short-subunit alcohol dehydrogenase family)
MAGLRGIPLGAAYGASKHAVMGLTKIAAIEYAKFGVRVNAVCPVFTHSPMLDELFASDSRLEDKLLKTIPVRRYGVASDITNAILWLAHPDSSFVTGLCLPVDGGQSA